MKLNWNWKKKLTETWLSVHENDYANAGLQRGRAAVSGDDIEGDVGSMMRQTAT